MDVVAAVIVADGRVLACRRRPELSSGGRWEFPGGKIEPNESPEAALIRELDEELGLQVRIGELFDATATVVDGVEINLLTYLAETDQEAPRSGVDHDQIGWFLRERLTWLRWADPDLAAVWRLASGSPF